MIKKNKKYLDLEEFGTDIGLSQLDKEMVRQKNRIMDYLKSIRIKKAWSQEELAKRIGTHQPAVARMEAGQVGEVSFDFLIRVALALGVSLELIPRKKAA